MRILDIYKKPLYTLYQWDINQFVNVVGINPEMPVSLQFWRAGQAEAFVVESAVSGNTVTATIPNELLREPGELVIYIWQDTGTGEQKGGRTETYFNIPIKERAQPSDYIYDDNVEYISVKTVIENAKNATEAATTAAKLATDTAADIKQRADNGEFNGKDGTDGKDGAPGAQGEPGQPGVDGKSATITIGTVTTVSPDTPASVTNTGTETDAVFDFEIPKGADGSGGGGADLDTLEKIAIKTTIEGSPAMSNSSADWRIPVIEGYGKSTQDADPTPEAPQEIKDCVVTGVKVTGKNFFDVSALKKDDSFEIKDNKITFVKKSTINSQISYNDIENLESAILKSPIKKLMVHCKALGSSVNLISIEIMAFTEDSPTIAKRFYMSTIDGGDVNPLNVVDVSNLTKIKTCKLFVNYKNSEIDYPNGWVDGIFLEFNENPKNPSLYEFFKLKEYRLSAPIIIRGIPSETGNVTIYGTKCLSDIIDKEKVTRHVGYIASYNGEDVGNLYMSTTGQLTTGATVIYALSEPTTEPLSPEDVQALTDLKTFYPSSVISWETEDGAGAWTRAEIIHDPANYIDEKLGQITAQQTALQAEILKIGGSI